jgi:maltoporin
MVRKRPTNAAPKRGLRQKNQPEGIHVRTKNKWFVFAAILVALAAPDVSAVDFHGYFRSGIGGTTKGGTQTCFGVPSNDFKFRLGNECENYAELEFTQSLYKTKGVEFVYDGMLAYVTGLAGPDFDSLKNAGNEIALRQNWIGVKGLPFLGGGMAWIGKRFYHRNDVHEIDFFYWDISGFGGGLDDVPIGPAKFAVAVMQNSFSSRRSIWRPDFRVYGIPIIPNGTLEAGISLYIDSSTETASPATNNSRQSVSPWITVQWAQTEFLGGFNKLAFQWGQGSASNLNQAPNLDAGTDQKQWRIVEHMVFQPTEAISGALVFVYQNKANVFKNATSPLQNFKSWSAGIRPAFQPFEYFKIAAEVGYTSVMPKDTISGGGTTDNQNLFKFTVAPTILPLTGGGGSYFTRPELRLFLTYAKWNDAAQRTGIAGQPTGTCSTAASTSPYGCDTNGVSFGAQVEAWY